MIHLAILLTLLQAFDGWTTYKIIRRGGSEANPLVAKAISILGLYPALVLLKAGAAALVWILVLFPTNLSAIALPVLTIVYLLVAWHNWKVWRGK